MYATQRSFHGSVEATPAEENGQIQCGDALVRPGDVMVGDNDGVLVVPSWMAEAVLEWAIEHEEAEKLRQAEDPRGRRVPGPLLPAEPGGVRGAAPRQGPVMAPPPATLAAGSLWHQLTSATSRNYGHPPLDRLAHQARRQTPACSPHLPLCPPSLRTVSLLQPYRFSLAPFPTETSAAAPRRLLRSSACSLPAVLLVSHLHDQSSAR